MGAPGTAGFSLRGKDGKERTIGQGLESLANMDDGTDRNVMPEAPEGSFRRRDLAAAAAGGDVADGRPKSQVGIDGKEYAFIAGGDSESGEEVDATNAKKRKLAMGGEEVIKRKKKSKKDKGKKSKDKKKKQKKKKKGKGEKKKKKKKKKK